jgi:hypothetical protein
MALLDFETALGRLVRVQTSENPFRGLDLAASERAKLATIGESAGFHFTVTVQRSWCRGRAAKAARLTLSILQPEQRQQLLEEWVDSGGGTASFFATEADAFLDFIAEHLPDPSHELTVCRMEQGTLRASEAARFFVPPNLSRLDAPGCMLRAGRYATLVRFHAEPRLLLPALGRGPLPPLMPDIIPVFLAPGLDGLFRVATAAELALWERLTAPVAFTALLQEGHQREAIEALVLAGGVELKFDEGAM